MDNSDSSLKKMHYIETKVDPILSRLTVDILTKQPDEPVEFMIKWLTDRKDFFKKNRQGKLTIALGDDKKLVESSAKDRS